jgi:PAS domain S-box-containing protein
MLIGALSAGLVLATISMIARLNGRLRSTTDELAGCRADLERAEHILNNSERQLQSILGSTHEAIMIVDDQGRFVDCNPAALELYGRTRDDLIGRHLTEFVEADFEFKPSWEMLRKHGRFGGEARIARPDGSVRDIEFVWTANTQPRRHLSILHDVTDRESAEEDLMQSLQILRQLNEERRRLLVSLVDAQEQERQRIAEDIHDDPVQAMTDVGMQLDQLRGRVGGPEDRTIVEELTRKVDRCIGRLRNLLFELQPPSLDRGGLVAAVGEHLERQARESGFDFAIHDELTIEPAPEVGVIVYRIAQEAIRNVRKHARATGVDVVIEGRYGGIYVRVRDDGAGFSMEEKLGGGREHLGLASMRDRAETAGGWWRVESIPMEGTILEFWVPSMGEELPDRAERKLGVHA